MKMRLGMALVCQLILCGCEAAALGQLKNKRDLWKYYTFLQNLIAFAASAVAALFLAAAVFGDCAVPEFVKGLRYVATCGLLAAMAVYVLFLSSNPQNQLTEKDFIRLSPQKANFILHYLCPVLSLVSFVWLEGPIPLVSSVWTACAPLPSALYWIAYLVLSAAKVWEEPYAFSSAKPGWKKTLSEVASLLLIPVLFILISFVLWEIQ